MAQLKTIPFTSEVPVKENGEYNFAAPISCTSLTVPDGGITFGSGVHFCPNGEDAKCYSEQGEDKIFQYSGMGIFVEEDILCCGDVHINNSIHVSSIASSTGLNVTGSGGIYCTGDVSTSGRFVNYNDHYYFSGDMSTRQVYYKPVPNN